jgi:hypothetical protein
MVNAEAAVEETGVGCAVVSLEWLKKTTKKLI